MSKSNVTMFFTPAGLLNFLPDIFSEEISLVECCMFWIYPKMFFMLLLLFFLCFLSTAN